jgi:hypothetical protein
MTNLIAAAMKKKSRYHNDEKKKIYIATKLISGSMINFYECRKSSCG